MGGTRSNAAVMCAWLLLTAGGCKDLFHHGPEYIFQDGADGLDGADGAPGSDGSYRVTFVKNAGTEDSTVIRVTPPPNRVAAEKFPADPEWAGHVFEGWYAAGGKFTADTPVTGDMTVYARWTGDTPSAAPLLDIGEITHYFFTNPANIGSIGKTGGDSIDTAVSIDISYTYGTPFPVSDNYIVAVHTGSISTVDADGEEITDPEYYWVEVEESVFQRYYKATGASAPTKYYRVTAVQAADTGIPGVMGRVFVTSHPSPATVSGYKAQLYKDSFTAETFTAAGTGLNIDDDATLMPSMVDIAFTNGPAPANNTEYVLLLKTTEGKNVGYFNNVTFTSGFAMVSWNDMWHTFENVDDFNTFMGTPDSAYNGGSPYRIALSGIDMTALSAGGAGDLYPRLKSTFDYSFDFRGCTGESFTSAANHQNPARIREVYLNAGLKTVGEYAFDGCSNLSEIALPSGVAVVGDYAFRNTALASVDFSDRPLTTIGASAFNNCDSLKTVNLSGTPLETIGAAAFYSCGTLSQVDLSAAAATLKTIGSINDSNSTSSGAFAICTYLSTVNLSACKKLETVGDYTFYYCSQFKDGVNLANTGLQGIGRAAFYQSGITSLDLTGCTALAAVGASAFYNCAALATADLSGCTSLASIGTLVTSPSSANGAFAGCAILKTVNLASCVNLVTIGDYTFSQCPGLKSNDYDEEIDLDKTGKIIGLEQTSLATIGKYAFSQSGLTKFVLQNFASLTTIDNNAFASCASLVDINLSKCTGLTSIGSAAFSGSGPTSGDTKLSVNMSGCTSLTTLQTTTSAATNVFYGCANIAKVDLNGCTSLTTIQLGTTGMLSSRARLEYVNLSGCKELMTIANSVFYGSGASIGTAKMKIDMSGCEKLTSIGTSNTASVFTGCTALAILDMSGCTGLTTIATGIFNNRDKLETIDLSGCTSLESIGNQAFYDCALLTTVDLSGCINLKSIGTLVTSPSASNGAFAGCAILETVNLASCVNLVTIGDYTFYQCPKLLSNEGMGLGQTGLTTIGKYAFSQNGLTATTGFGLTKFVLKNLTSLTTIDTYAFYNCKALTDVDLSGCSGLTAIAASMFSGCEALDTITLTGCTGLTNIGTSAFSGCKALATINLSVCTGLTSIGSSAFSNCINLANINLSACTILTSIGSSAFSNCINLANINLSACTGLTSIGSSAFAYTGLTSFSLHLSSLTAIGSSAFDHCAYLINVDLSGCTSLWNIGSSAFAYCATSPSDATLEVNLSGCFPLDTTNTINISGVFTNCANLVKVDLSNCKGLTAIPTSLFSSRTKLTEVKLTGCTELATIGNYAFQNCAALNAINLTGCIKLATIGNSAFSGCTALTDVLTASNLDSVKDSLKTIGANAFEKSGVTSAELNGCPQSLTIGESAFDTAKQLGTLKLPAALTSVGNYAFKGCESLYNIYIYIINTDTLGGVFSGEQTFAGIPGGVTVHVPAGKQSAYTEFWQSKPSWQQGASIQSP